MQDLTWDILFPFDRYNEIASNKIENLTCLLLPLWNKRFYLFKHYSKSIRTDD